MLLSFRRIVSLVSIILLSFVSFAQPINEPPVKKELKPYKVLTLGRQISIKSTKNISHVMLWTSGGDRLVEQREINNSSYTFTIPINGKIFFLMIGLDNGKIYTEKIGIQ